MVLIDDDTLIGLIRTGDTHAEALLCEKYLSFAQNLGKKYASLYSDLGLSADEFTAVAFTSLAIALNKYTPNKEKSFYSYWTTIAKNQCINFVRNNSYSNNDFIHPLSLDSSLFDDGLTLHETCGSDDVKISYSVERKLVYDFITSKDSKLTNDERLVGYFTFIEGYNFEEIKMLTKWKADKVYRVSDSVRKKVSNFFKSGYFK